MDQEKSQLIPKMLSNSVNQNKETTYCMQMVLNAYKDKLPNQQDQHTYENLNYYLHIVLQKRMKLYYKSKISNNILASISYAS